MKDKEEKNHNYSDAIQAHLSISQSIIQRMAVNSTSCKGWCIAIVSAILVIITDKGNPNYSAIALIPVLLFSMLDTFYLALEKRFRSSYNQFIEKLHRNEISASDLYVIIPQGASIRTFVKSLISFSVWPFYITLLFMILIVWIYVL